MKTVSERIADHLQRRFEPTLLEVADDSAKHAGHAGARPRGETHFSVTIVSTKFEGLSRVARHRLIYDTLTTYFHAGLHALAIDAKTPEETSKE